jgi:signal transduction histidine kinase
MATPDGQSRTIPVSLEYRTLSSDECSELRRGSSLSLGNRLSAGESGSRRLPAERLHGPSVEQQLADAREELRAAVALIQQSQEELVQTQMQLIDAERLESAGRLAAGVAHEVKNPLAVVLMGVQFLEKSLPSDGATLQVLRSMREAVCRADNIVHGLMNFCAPAKLERKPHDLNALVEQSLHLVKHELLVSHVTTVLHLAAAMPLIEIDGPKISQVLVNIVTNAAHAMSGGGTLTIGTAVLPAPEATEGRRGVAMEVLDTGAGIPANVLAHIFDPFFTTKSADKGNGLGLTVVRQIIDMHQGTIVIGNRTDARGAAVRIVLPIKK